MQSSTVSQDVSTQVASSSLSAAQRLYTFMQRHINEQGAMVGPDSGVRWNLRVGRFVKSYLPFFKFKDENRFYVQGQGYWILSNLALHKQTGEDRYLDAARKCAEVVIQMQTPEGCWIYQDPAWGGRIVTVEGCFGCLAMLGMYRATQEKRFLDAATKYYDFLMTEVGFQQYDADSYSINYFSNFGRGLIPNNSTLALWVMAELADITGEERYLERTPGMLNFLERCQMSNGEFPYAIKTEQGYGRDHYLCFEYHAFQFLDLASYFELTQCERTRAMLVKVAEFLSGGMTEGGDAKYNCFKVRPMVPYYTAAVSAALLSASRLGIGDYSHFAERGFSRLISLQRKDGGFDYSVGNYLVLKDRRSYPRMQVMILRHLLMCALGATTA